MSSSTINNEHIHREATRNTIYSLLLSSFVAIVITIIIYFNEKFISKYVKGILGGLLERSLQQGIVPYLIFGVFISATVYAIFCLKKHLIPFFYRVNNDIKKINTIIIDKKNQNTFSSFIKISEKADINSKGRLYARFQKLDFIYSDIKIKEIIRENNDRLSAIDESEVSYSLQPFVYAMWVLPILGFIGTVWGVTGAIAGLRNGINALFISGGLTPQVQSQLMVGFDGLGLAFDTTFLGLFALALIGTIHFIFRKSAIQVIIAIDKTVDKSIHCIKEEKDEKIYNLLKNFFITDKDDEITLGDDKKPVLRLQKFLEKGLFLINSEGNMVIGEDNSPVLRMQKFIEQSFFMTDDEGNILIGDDKKPVIRWQQWMDHILKEFYYYDQEGKMLPVSKSEYFRKQLISMLIQEIFEVTSDQAEEVAKGYVENYEFPVPLRSQFSRRHRHIMAQLSTNNYFVEKITDNISQIHKFLSFKSNTDLSIRNSKSNNLSKFRKNQIYEQSNTPITSIASNNHYFAITRDSGDNTGENELLIGTFEITPGGGHTRLVSKDKISISEITIGLGIIGHTCICAFEGSKSICGYDLEQIDDLPEDIGIIEEETFVKHSVCILSHNDTLHVVLMINNEKKSLVSFPVDGSSPDPKIICDIDEEFVSTVVVNPDVGISWITQSENSTVLNILNSSFEIITQSINIHDKISALAFDPKTEERICLATADGNIIIMKNLKIEKKYSVKLKSINLLAIATGGYIIASIKHSKQLIIIEQGKKTTLHKVEFDQEIDMFHMSKNGKYLFVTCREGSLFYLDFSGQ